VKTINLPRVPGIRTKDLLLDAIAEAAETGLTWVDVDGEHKAAIVAPEFGLFVELLMSRDTRIRASITRPDGSVQDISGGPDDCTTDVQVTKHSAREASRLRVGTDLVRDLMDPATRTVNDGLACRNCGKTQSEHCTGHVRQHCPGYCYGTVDVAPRLHDAVWEMDHTWTGPDQRPAELKDGPPYGFPASRDPEDQA
jgi:hypothetical protein